MTSMVYNFPAIIDPDPEDTGSIVLVKHSVTGLLPSFITLNTSSLNINPT
jgi:hypothetical protein